MATREIVHRYRVTDEGTQKLDEIGRRIRTLGDESEQFERRSSSSFGRIATSIGGITTALAGVGIGFAAIDFARGSLAAAAQVQALQARLESLTGSVAKAREYYTQFAQIAATTPFQLRNVVEAGVSLEAFGAQSRSTLKSVADLAAFMGTDVVDAAQSFGRAWASGAGAADVLRERGVLALVAMRAGVDDLTKLSLPEFRKALFSAMVDPAGQIAGATNRLAKTYSGLISNLQDEFFNLQAEIGSIITESDVLPGVLGNIAGEIREVARQVDEWVGKNREMLDSGIREFFETLPGNLRNAAGAMSNLATSAGNYYEALRPLIDFARSNPALAAGIVGGALRGGVPGAAVGGLGGAVLDASAGGEGFGAEAVRVLAQVDYFRGLLPSSFTNAIGVPPPGGRARGTEDNDVALAVASVIDQLTQGPQQPAGGVSVPIAPNFGSGGGGAAGSDGATARKRAEQAVRESTEVLLALDKERLSLQSQRVGFLEDDLRILQQQDAPAQELLAAARQIDDAEQALLAARRESLGIQIQQGVATDASGAALIGLRTEAALLDAELARGPQHARELADELAKAKAPASALSQELSRGIRSSVDALLINDGKFDLLNVGKGLGKSLAGGLLDGFLQTLLTGADGQKGLPNLFNEVFGSTLPEAVRGGFSRISEIFGGGVRDLGAQAKLANFDVNATFSALPTTSSGLGDIGFGATNPSAGAAGADAGAGGAALGGAATAGILTAVLATANGITAAVQSFSDLKKSIALDNILTDKDFAKAGTGAALEGFLGTVGLGSVGKGLGGAIGKLPGVNASAALIVGLTGGFAAPAFFQAGKRGVDTNVFGLFQTPTRGQQVGKGLERTVERELAPLLPQTTFSLGGRIGLDSSKLEVFGSQQITKQFAEAGFADSTENPLLRTLQPRRSVLPNGEVKLHFNDGFSQRDFEKLEPLLRSNPELNAIRTGSALTLGGLLAAPGEENDGDAVRISQRLVNTFQILGLSAEEAQRQLRVMAGNAGFDFATAIEQLNTNLIEGSITVQQFQTEVAGAAQLFEKDLPKGINAAALAAQFTNEKDFLDLAPFLDEFKRLNEVFGTLAASAKSGLGDGISAFTGTVGGQAVLAGGGTIAQAIAAQVAQSEAPISALIDTLGQSAQVAISTNVFKALEDSTSWQAVTQALADAVTNPSIYAQIPGLIGDSIAQNAATLEGAAQAAQKAREAFGLTPTSLRDQAGQIGARVADLRFGALDPKEQLATLEQRKALLLGQREDILQGGITGAEAPIFQQLALDLAGLGEDIFGVAGSVYGGAGVANKRKRLALQESGLSLGDQAQSDLQRLAREQSDRVKAQTDATKAQTDATEQNTKAIQYWTAVMRKIDPAAFNNALIAALASDPQAKAAIYKATVQGR